MPVFDSIVITTDGIHALATIARPTGPLENGRYDPASGVWIPAQDPTVIDAPGFGIEAGSGRPYFDTNGPSPTEAAQLAVDATTNTLWLEADL